MESRQFINLGGKATKASNITEYQHLTFKIMPVNGIAVSVFNMYVAQFHNNKFGVPKGIRTPVTAVKGRCPRPLDDGDTWSQAGSNRRPLACHASALPAEL